MSGTSYDNPCPKCGGEMNCYSDWKPYDTVAGECLNCGFAYYTEEKQHDLKTVNEIRAEVDLKPIKKLKKQKN